MPIEISEDAIEIVDEVEPVSIDIEADFTVQTNTPVTLRMSILTVLEINCVYFEDFTTFDINGLIELLMIYDILELRIEKSAASAPNLSPILICFLVIVYVSSVNLGMCIGT